MTEILKEGTIYPNIRMKNKIMTDKWYLDDCDQAATLYVEPHIGFFSSLFWTASFSANARDVIVLFNLSESTSQFSWTRESFSLKDLWSSIAIEKRFSKFEKRVKPISLVVDRNFPIEESPSGTKLCLDVKVEITFY